MLSAVSAFRTSLCADKTDTQKSQATQVDYACGQEDFYLDPNNADHLQRLDDWCQFQWRATIQRNLDQKNRLRYSQCCNSFIRRGFVKTAGHPQNCTIQVEKLFRMNDITTADQLRDWMIHRARQLIEGGQHMLFPSLKRCHTVMGIEEVAEQYKAQKELLQRQCDQLQEELRQAKLQLDKSQTGTHGLLSAVKHWHSLYEDLLDKYEDPDAGYSEPQKKHKLSSDFELCL